MARAEYRRLRAIDGSSDLPSSTTESQRAVCLQSRRKPLRGVAEACGVTPRPDSTFEITARIQAATSHGTTDARVALVRRITCCAARWMLDQKQTVLSSHRTFTLGTFKTRPAARAIYYRQPNDFGYRPWLARDTRNFSLNPVISERRRTWPIMSFRVSSPPSATFRTKSRGGRQNNYKQGGRP